MKLPVRHSPVLVLSLFVLAIWLHPYPIHALAHSQTSATPASGEHDGPAELPRAYVESSLRNTPAPGKIIPVRAGGDPSEALAHASCGDIIQLQAGATFDLLILPN